MNLYIKIAAPKNEALVNEVIFNPIIKKIILNITYSLKIKKDKNTYH